jgi:putative hydrolase of the HAD superfamily
MLPLRALVLDLGEVLVHSQPPELIRRMAEVAEVPQDALSAGYWTHRNAYDLHGDAGRYWEAVLSQVGSPLSGAAREAAPARLSALDAESWTQYREPVWEITRSFRARGGRTALLSNCGPEVMDRVRAQRPTDRIFDAMVVSWEVGCLKPDPAIYRIALERLGVAPGEALFADDRLPNVAGARAVGMRALHFTGEESVEALRELVSPG